MAVAVGSPYQFFSSDYSIMPTTSIDAKNNDDFIAILPYTWFPQFLLTTTEIIAVRGCA
jgi:hypothetical protein